MDVWTHMALAAIIMFAEEQKISKTTKSAHKLTKSLQGTLEKCSHSEKTLGTAIKRKELCYLGVCDAFTSGDSSAAILEISTPLLAVMLIYARLGACAITAVNLQSCQPLEEERQDMVNTSIVQILKMIDKRKKNQNQPLVQLTFYCSTYFFSNFISLRCALLHGRV